MKPSELLKRKKNWTQGAMARGRSGKEVDVCGRSAVCWCVLGALERCNVLDEGREALRQVLLRHRKKHPTSITFWNDSPDTTHADILAVLKECNL